MAISSLDNRYYEDIKQLITVCDEFAYYRNRIYVELEYFKRFTNCEIKYNPMIDFNNDDFNEIMKKEKVLRHDVKAIEYFIKELPEIKESGKAHLIHIGLTSQDICSYGFIMCIDNGAKIILENLATLSTTINANLIENVPQDILMLGYTHGQPATPTSFKKEMILYQNRLDNIYIEINKFLSSGLTVKFGGATGQLNSLVFARPEINWDNWCNKFILMLGKGRYTRSSYVNQCDNYDSICNLLYMFKRLLHILEHFRGNVWLYIHKGYLMQKAVEKEIGSSTMPNKVNPIDIENAKTAIELGKRMIDGICDILNETSYQRDVSDSSALRNISSVFGYILVAIKKINNGVKRLIPNKEIINRELVEHPEVILEGIQTYLKYHCEMSDAYEKMKDVSRGKTDITLKDIYDVIDKLDILEEHKNKLKTLKPENYIGFNI